MNSHLALYLRSVYRRSDLGPAGNLVESRWATNVLSVNRVKLSHTEKQPRAKFSRNKEINNLL